MPDDTTKIIQIPLTKGYIAIVDECDGDLAELNWYPAKKKDRVYVWGKTGVSVKGQKKTIHLHRVIFERMCGYKLGSKQLVDHKDNNPLNNIRGNLRLADKSKNAMNAKLRSDNSTGYKGVWFHKQAGKWAADIKVNKRKKSLGLFDTPEQAYQAYCDAAREHYGEFARLK